MKRYVPFLAFPAFGSCNAIARPNVLFIAIDDQNDWIGEKIDLPPAPYSANRVLTHYLRTDLTVWEGKALRRGDSISQ